MNILLICNNYDSIRDGIGKYAKIIAEELKKREAVDNVFYTTGYTDDSSRLKMLFSFRMSLAMLRGVACLMKQKVEIVMLEYPFQEYNPLIVPLFALLKKVCKIKKAKLVVSVHEYKRTNSLRKKVINFMVKRADLVLVSDRTSMVYLKEINRNTILRDMIGTVFPPSSVKWEEKVEKFTYFGLINRSKAFDEMSETWKKFNTDGSKKLTIITSTEIDIEDMPGVEVKRNLSEEEVAECLMSSRYMILPILPEITAVNGTFKTAALFGCICIGHFCDILKNKDFVVESHSYEPDIFLKALETACDISEPDKKIMFDKAIEYGKLYSPEQAVNHLLDCFRNLLTGGKD